MVGITHLATRLSFSLLAVLSAAAVSVPSLRQSALDGNRAANVSSAADSPSEGGRYCPGHGYQRQGGYCRLRHLPHSRLRPAFRLPGGIHRSRWEERCPRPARP